MNDLLKKMNPEKRLALINAAMKEFGDNSFKKASTNTIVKEAGISKGLLYHYFTSKQVLYDYLVEFTMRAISETIAEEIGYKDRDIIRRMESIAKKKIEIINQYPSMIAFSKVMFVGMDYEAIKEVSEKYTPIPMEKYYQYNIDESLFKDGIDVKMAVKVIQFTLEKVSEGLVNQRNMGMAWDLDLAMVEFENYMKHFRKTYYKEAVL